MKKNVTEMKSSKPGRAAAVLKRLAANPVDVDEGNSFTLTSHSEENLTDKEQLERISNYFASIANEFPKLKEEDLSEEVKHKLNNIEHNEIPSISSQYVYDIMRQIKKKKSSVPGDIPPRLFNNDDVRLSLAEPGAMLANSVAKSGQWPRQFKTE